MAIANFLIYSIIGIISLAFYLLKRNFSYWKTQGIPHDEPHLVMGNFKGWRTKHHVGEILADYYRKFKGTGPFAGFYFVQRSAVVILDKSLIKQVLIKEFNNFIDRGLYYNEKDDPLTGHLFFLDGQKWKNLRNKLSPTFTSSKMLYMYPILLKVNDQFLEILSEKVKVDPVINIYDMLSRLTIDVISSCAFGIESKSLLNPNSEFPRLGKKSVVQPRHNAFIMALIDGFPRIARFLGMRILTEDVHQFFMKTITETINFRESHNIQRNDFLNILLELKNNTNDKSGLGGLSVEEICAQVFIFFLGGFETASSTVTYALYELAKHPDLQERLREEVNEVVENSPDGRITYEQLKEMTYLEQVLAETLRKFPVVAQLNRQALNDYIVPGHPKYVIKKGMPVLIPVLGLHHDAEFYPEPHLFDPERFSPEMTKQRDSSVYLPFGDGPRNCIGKRFGQMQTRLALANLIRNYRFMNCSPTEMPIEIEAKALAYVPKNIIYLKLEEIKVK